MLAEIDNGSFKYYIQCDDDSFKDTQSGRNAMPTGETVGDKVIHMSEELFCRLGELASSLADKVGNGMQDACPDEWELECGFKLGTSGNFILVKGEAETSIKLRMKWKNEQ